VLACGSCWSASWLLWFPHILARDVWSDLSCTILRLAFKFVIGKGGLNPHACVHCSLDSRHQKFKPPPKLCFNAL
jgi:hypothetical protein